MRTRTHNLKWLTGILAFSMAVALVGIPISYALHTHAHGPDTCVDAHGHSHGASQELPEGACDLCAFYAYYAPREAAALCAFSFGTWAMPWPIHVGKLRAGQPRTALVSRDANRGPPVAKRIG